VKRLGTNGANGTNGTDGADGNPIVWKGAYNAETEYHPLDALYFTDGKPYICKLTSTGNAPTNTTYFDLLFDLPSNIVLNISNSITSSATPTPAVGTAGAQITFEVTALAEGATFGAPTGTPVHNQLLEIAITDNGTPQTIAMSSATGGYVAPTVPFSTVTVASTRIKMLLQYNSVPNKWELLSVA
jgi:hypothetical protein